MSCSFAGAGGTGSNVFLDGVSLCHNVPFVSELHGDPRRSHPHPHPPLPFHIGIWHTVSRQDWSSFIIMGLMGYRAKSLVRSQIAGNNKCLMWLRGRLRFSYSNPPSVQLILNAVLEFLIKAERVQSDGRSLGCTTIFVFLIFTMMVSFFLSK